MKKPARGRPVEVKNGRSVAKIHLTGRSYTLCWFQHGMRQREVFGLSKLEKAYERADQIVKALEEGAEHLVEVSSDHLKYLNACDELARDAGLSLMQAVQDAVAMHKARIKLKPATCLELSKELLKEKEQDGASEPYRDQLRWVFTPFAERFKQPIHEIEASDINTWLRSREVGVRSRKNMLGSLRMLFSYAKTKDALLQDVPTAAERVTTAKTTPTHAVDIFTIDEIGKLLRAAEASHRQLLPVLALGAFCGVRTDGEITRIEWSDILADKVIVAKQKLRGAGRRYVPLHPNAKIWLGRCKYRRGLIWKGGKLWEEMEACAETAKVKWKRNALRHSYISYRVAEIQNVPQVALEAGNSVNMIHKHYRELVTREKAKEWFHVLPKTLTDAEKMVLNPPALPTAPFALAAPEDSTLLAAAA